VPLRKLQTEILRTLARHRSPESYIAGGVAFGEQGQRFSDDIDIFHDDGSDLGAVVKSDVKALRESGFTVEPLTSPGTGVHRVKVEKLNESTVIEWVADADFRFFPIKPDELFGYVLHPVDLAINKAAAAAGRREPRDIVDLVTIHENILPLGAVVAATVGRFPGPSPEEILAEISRRSRLTPSEISALSAERPIDPSDLHRRIRLMLDDAEDYLQRLPSDAVGFVFLKNGKPVQPDPTRLQDYEKHEGSRRGRWPSSSEIGPPLLERLIKNKN